MATAISLPHILGEIGNLGEGNPAGAPAVGAVGSTAISNTKSAVGTALDSVPKFLAFLGQRETWVRIMEGTIGVLMIVVALAKLAEGTQTGKIAAGVASKVGVAVA